MSSVITQPDSDCHWNRTRLRVPKDDGSLYAVPCLKKGVLSALDNQVLLNSTDITILDEPLDQFRKRSRSEVITAAKQYRTKLVGTAQCACEEHLASESKPLIVGGHQPALFHPGVWVKNFAINRMAQQAGGTALHLIVDNDVLSTTALRVPAGNRNAPTVSHILFDDERAAQPWEEATINNRDLFHSFGKRVSDAMSQWSVSPLIKNMWQQAIDKSQTSDSLRDALTIVRVQQEREWGVNNLELPISQLCELDSFFHFVLHLLIHLEEFQTVHNQTLAEYREVYHVRSKTHPVPELVNYGDGWLEAPFWIWQASDQQRQQLRVKREGNTLLLSDGNNMIATLPNATDKEPTAALSALKTVAHQGWKFRTRALTTTLFSRLCVADLFVHGIGGAKYDELTDQIICRFFKISAPQFSTVSATLFLPIAKPFDTTVDEERAVKNELRKIQYNPNQQNEQSDDLPENPAIDELMKEREQLIQQQKEARATSADGRKARREKTPENRSRFLRLKQIREELSNTATTEVNDLRAKLNTVQNQLAANRILASRDFSFALYPTETLSSFMMNIGK